MLRDALTTIILIVLVCTCVRAQPYWDLLDNFPPPVKTCLYGVHDSILYAGTSNGVFRSTSAGQAWESILVSSTIYSIYASGSGIVLAGGGGKVFYSYDEGNT